MLHYPETLHAIASVHQTTPSCVGWLAQIVDEIRAYPWTLFSPACTSNLQGCTGKVYLARFT